MTGVYNQANLSDPGRLGYFNDDGVFIENEPQAIYREYIDIFKSVTIYQYRKDYKYVNDVKSGWTWDVIVSNLEESNCGRRQYGEITFNFKDLPAGVLRCFWAVENDGVVSKGVNLITDVGIRSLPIKYSSFSSKSQNETFFEDGVRFEKYT